MDDIKVEHADTFTFAGIEVTHEFSDDGRHWLCTGDTVGLRANYNEIAFLRLPQGYLYGAVTEYWQDAFGEGVSVFQIIAPDAASETPNSVEEPTFQSLEPKSTQHVLDTESQPAPSNLPFDEGLTETHPADNGHRITD